jgi:hypothetical protein
MTALWCSIIAVIVATVGYVAIVVYCQRCPREPWRGDHPES